MNPTFERCYRRGLEAAEGAYRKAKQQGLADPIVEIMALDPAEPNRIEVCFWTRAEMIRSLKDNRSALAQVLRMGPTLGKPFTIVIATPEGMTFVERAAPE